MDGGDLQQLSKEEPIEPVLKLQRPEKTSRSSSSMARPAIEARRRALELELAAWQTGP